MPITSFSEAMHQLFHSYRHLLREGLEAQQIDLPVTHIRALKGISRQSQVTALLIAQRMQKDKAQITRVLNDLIDAKLITRKENLEDRRSKFLVLTPQGEKALKRCHRAEQWAVAKMTDGIAPQELEAFLRISKIMINSVDDNVSNMRGTIADA